MASIPSSQVTTPDVFDEMGPGPVREKRTSQLARGVKHGLIKGTVDQVMDQIAGPIADKIIPRLHELHPGLKVADPAIKSVIELAVLNILAEVLQYGGPVIGKIPGMKMSQEEAIAKTQALSRWMRNHSGEKLGENIAETAAALIPIVAGLLADVDLSELLSAVGEEDTGLTLDVTEEVSEPAYNATHLFAGKPGIQEGSG